MLVFHPLWSSTSSPGGTHGPVGWTPSWTRDSALEIRFCWVVHEESGTRPRSPLPSHDPRGSVCSVGVGTLTFLLPSSLPPVPPLPVAAFDVSSCLLVSVQVPRPSRDSHDRDPSRSSARPSPSGDGTEPVRMVTRPDRKGNLWGKSSVENTDYETSLRTGVRPVSTGSRHYGRRPVDHVDDGSALWTATSLPCPSSACLG